MRARRASVFLSVSSLVAAGVLVHCGDTSFDSASDASSDAPVDGANDGPNDSSKADAQSSGDGASDSSPPANPCVGAEHWICDTFDRGGAISDFPFWDPSTISGDASLQMTPPGGPAPPSAPNALVSITASGAGAFVNKASGTTATGLHCEVDFRIDDSAIDYGSNLVVLTLYGNPGYYRLVMTAGPTGGASDGFGDYGILADAAPFSTGTERHDFPRGAWTHVSIEAAARSGEPNILINGTSVAYASSVDLAALSTVSTISVQLGTANFNGTGGWSVAYDNAFCDLLP